MSDADTAPDEEVGESGQRKEPSEEDATTRGGLVDEGKEAKGNLEQDCWDRATVTVDIGQDFWCHAVRSQRLERSG